MNANSNRTMHLHGRSLAELEAQPIGRDVDTEDMEAPAAEPEVIPGALVTPVGGMSMLGDETTTLADFDVHNELGRGGCAAVYLATHRATGERVALKVLHDSESKDPEVRERFRREASAASRIRHPNICAIRAFGEDPSGRLFLAFELLDGSDLGTFIRKHGALPSPVAVAIIAHVLEALGAAHDMGVLHRDIKPGNIMITNAGVVKLVDFGIAKSKDDPALTAQGIVVGTPAYMCPEQIGGGEADLRWDLYAVGITLFEMLSGDNPYVHLQPVQAVMEIATNPLPSLFDRDPTVPGIVEHVLEKLTARNPTKRYASTAEALADLRPMRSIVEQVQPDLLRRFTSAPKMLATELRHNLAELEIARADVLLASGAANVPAAGFALYRATRLDPRPALLARLQVFCTDARLAFDTVDDDLIAVLKAKVKKDPYNALSMKHLGERYRSRGDVYQAAIWFRRALRLTPGDVLLRGQTDALLVGVPVLDPQQRLRVRELLTGLRMGSWGTVSVGRKQETLGMMEPRSSTGPARVTIGVDVVAPAKIAVPVGTITAPAAGAALTQRIWMIFAIILVCGIVGVALGKMLA